MSRKQVGAQSRDVHRGVEPPAPALERTSRVVHGDVMNVLAGLPEAGVQTAVTSPPYWGLRDYELPPTVWGGDERCRHRWDESAGGPRADMGAAGARGRCRRPRGRGGLSCRSCGAWKGCLGLEPDPHLYVEHLVEVMRGVRRCLRPDGTLWLVLGDSFAARSSAEPDRASGPAFQGPALKQKDLIGIPWRVAFALQADGWWLRAETVWNKPNAMPEPVGDRPTRAHEYVFLLAPSARYFYDSFAVREPDKGRRSGNGYARPERLSYRGAGGPRGQTGEWIGGGGRNRRSVWTIATQCFRDAHFATFPEALVEVCVLAGSSPVACGTCGSPWRRVVEARSRSCAAGASVARETVGWRSGCEHEDPGGRCTVLDPFAGSGTTGLVAARHGRSFVGVELSCSYVDIARSRMRAETTRPGSRRRRG